MDPAVWKDLAASLAGSLVLPDQPEYAPLRKSFLGRLTEVLPQAVVRCADEQDVAQAVRFARTHGLPFAVRSGGHSFADFCCTSGLLIDLGQLDSVRLDGEIATVGPGIRLGKLAERLADCGRVLPCGWNPLVAVGGLVLGGGYGMLSRYYGLGCDHLRAAQVVLADGSISWVDQQRDPELFWALRGAGWGSFAVVTELVLRTYPAPKVTTFVHRWPWRAAASVIDEWQRWAPTAPDEVNAELVLRVGGVEMEPRLTLFGAVVGNSAQARPLLADFVSRVNPADELEELTELSAWAGACRHTYAGGPVMDQPQPGPPLGRRQWLRAVKSEFFDRPMPREAIDALVEVCVADRVPGQYRELEFIPWGGAFRRVPPAATAFVHRTASFQIGHHAITGADADPERIAARDWVDRSWSTVHSWANGGVYPNYPDPELADWAEAYYGANLPRLRQVKARFDPDNLFQFAQSVSLPDSAADG